MRIDPWLRDLLVVKFAAAVLCIVQGRLGWFFIGALAELLLLSLFLFPVAVFLRAFALRLSFQSVVLLFVSILLSMFQFFSLLPTAQGDGAMM